MRERGTTTDLAILSLAPDAVSCSFRMVCSLMKLSPVVGIKIPTSFVNNLWQMVSGLEIQIPSISPIARLASKYSIRG